MRLSFSLYALHGDIWGDSRDGSQLDSVRDSATCFQDAVPLSVPGTTYPLRELKGQCVLPDSIIRRTACPSQPLLSSLLIPPVQQASGHYSHSRKQDPDFVLHEVMLHKFAANSKARGRCSLLRRIRKQDTKRPQTAGHSTYRAPSFDPGVSMGLSIFICKGDTRLILESYSTETRGFVSGLFSHLQHISSPQESRRSSDAQLYPCNLTSAPPEL